MIPLLQNILAQPENLARVGDYHLGDGQSALRQAARGIGSARRLILSGMGSSLWACYPLCDYLAARGILSTVMDAAELLHYQQRACRDAVVILVSRSGESVEVVKLLPLCKTQGATIIGITNEPGSTLARQSDHVVLMASRADEAVAVQTYTATLATLYLLGAAVVAEPSAEGELRSLIASMAAGMNEWVAASETWRSFFENASTIYLLARGASVASAMEGALLFHEVAKFPAISMGAGSFRHGPVEVVDDKFRAVVFAPNDATRELNLALARDLTRLGGQVHCIHPDAPAALAPVIEIVPVQLAALRLAEWRGIVPGKFRVAAQVTRTEEGF